jgi:hypothetical protein
MRGISKTVGATILVALVCIYAHGLARDRNTPKDKETRLTSRLESYVTAYKKHDWKSLFQLASKAARGSVTEEEFVDAMNTSHQRDFSNYPDLEQFELFRRLPDGANEFNLLGCGKATREGETYKGVAVIHVIFENENWYFAGWTFAQFADGSCEVLNDPKWKPEISWDFPMRELRR